MSAVKRKSRQAVKEPNVKIIPANSTTGIKYPEYTSPNPQHANRFIEIELRR